MHFYGICFIHMTKDIHFLIVGDILLTIGVLGYFTDNRFLAYFCLSLALIFFARQLISMYFSKPFAGMKHHSFSVPCSVPHYYALGCTTTCNPKDSLNFFVLSRCVTALQRDRDVGHGVVMQQNAADTEITRVDLRTIVV
jgi:hypothetical protein